MTRRKHDDPDATKAGTGPWEPWHYVGFYVVAENPVVPGQTAAKVAKAKPPVRKFVADTLVSVIESTKAINKMMGRHELAGADLGAHDDEG